MAKETKADVTLVVDADQKASFNLMIKSISSVIDEINKSGKLKKFKIDIDDKNFTKKLSDLKNNIGKALKEFEKLSSFAIAAKNYGSAGGGGAGVKTEYTKLLSDLKEAERIQKRLSSGKVGANEGSLLRGRLSSLNAQIAAYDRALMSEEQRLAITKEVQRIQHTVSVEMSKQADSAAKAGYSETLKNIKEIEKIQKRLAKVTVSDAERESSQARLAELKALVANQDRSLMTDQQRLTINNELLRVQRVITAETALETAKIQEKLAAELSALSQKNSRGIANAGLGREVDALLSKLGTKGSFGNPTEVMKEYDALIAKLKEAGVISEKANQRFKDIFRANISSSVTYAAISKVTQALRETVAVVVELDRSLVNIQMVIGGTRNEVRALIDSYGDLAHEIGASTTEVAAAANEWLRQGYTLDETREAVKATMIMSKIGSIESSQAAQFLTSATKGYQIAIEDSISVVDKMSAVDMTAAVSVSGLAEAMSKTANSARLSGVEIDTLLGYLAAVGEVTQQDMASVGNAFKTMFARYSNVKLGRLEDEDGESLNDYERILNRIGIKLRSSAGDFRDFDDVLEDVHNSWEDLNDVEKSAVAAALGATRQKENVLTLMENYGNAMRYATVATESDGSAMQKYGAYTSGVEGSLAKLSATLEGIATGLLNSNLLADLLGITDAILSIVKGVLSLSDALGGISPILPVITLGLSKIFNINFAGRLKDVPGGIKNIGKWFSGIPGMVTRVGDGIANLVTKVQNIPRWFENIGKTSKVAQKGLENVGDAAQDSGEKIKVAGKAGKVLSSALNTIIGAGIGLAIELVIQGLNSLIFAAEENAKSVATMLDTYNESRKTMSSARASIGEFGEELVELSAHVGANGENIGLSSDQYDRYLEIVSQVEELFPSLIKGYNEEGKAILKQTELLRDMNDELRERERLNAAKLIADNDAIIQASRDARELTWYEEFESWSTSDVAGAGGADKLLAELYRGVSGGSLSNKEIADLIYSIVGSNYIVGWGNDKRRDWFGGGYLDFSEKSDGYVSSAEDLLRYLDKNPEVDVLEWFSTEGLAVVDKIESEIGLAVDGLRDMMDAYLVYSRAYGSATTEAKNFARSVIPNLSNDFIYGLEAEEYDRFAMSFMAGVNKLLAENGDAFDLAINFQTMFNNNKVTAKDYYEHVDSVNELISSFDENAQDAMRIVFGIEAGNDIESGINHIRSLLSGSVAEIEAYLASDAVNAEVIALSKRLSAIDGQMSIDEFEKTLGVLRLDKVNVSDVASEYEKIKNAYEALISAQKEMAENGSLTSETLNKLAEEYPELYEQVEKTENGFSLSNKAIETYLDAIGQLEHSQLQDAISGFGALVGGLENVGLTAANSALEILELVDSYLLLAESQDILNRKEFIGKRLDSGMTLQQAQSEWIKFADAYNLLDGTVALETFNKTDIDNLKTVANGIRNAVNNVDTISSSKAGAMAHLTEKVDPKTIEELFEEEMRAYNIAKSLMDAGLPWDTALLSGVDEYYEKLDQLNEKYYGGQEEFIKEYTDNLISVAEGQRDQFIRELDLNETLAESMAKSPSGYYEAIDAYAEMQDKVSNEMERYREKMSGVMSESEIEETEYMMSLREKWQQYADSRKNILDNIFGENAAALDSEMEKLDALYAEEDENDNLTERLRILNEQKEVAIKSVKNTEDLLSAMRDSGIDYTDANYREVEKDLRSAYATIRDINASIAESSIETYDRIISRNDNFDLWGVSNIDKVDLLREKLRHVVELYQSGIMSAKRYSEIVEEINSEIYNTQKDAIENIIDLTKELIKQETEDRQSAIEDQIDAYKEIIALKKESLSVTKEEDNYARNVADKAKDISELQFRIASLSNDTSRSGQNQRKALIEELSEMQRELDDIQKDYAYNNQIEALDKEAENYEKARNEEIEAVRQTIDTEEKLHNQAIERINAAWADMSLGITNTWSGLYRSLIESNDLYGQDVLDVSTNWDIATQALQRYSTVQNSLTGIQAGAVMSMPAIPVVSGFGSSAQISAPASIGSTEMLSQITSLGGSANTQSVTVSMPLQLYGSLDQSVLDVLSKYPREVANAVAKILGQT